MTQRTCRELGGFEPDIRHRTNDATVSLALVAAGLAVTLLPELVLPRRHPGVALRAIAEGPVEPDDLRRHARHGRRAPVHAGGARRRAGSGRGAAAQLNQSRRRRYPTPRTVSSAPARSPSLRRSPDTATSTTLEPPVHS